MVESQKITFLSVYSRNMTENIRPRIKLSASIKNHKKDKDEAINFICMTTCLYVCRF